MSDASAAVDRAISEASSPPGRADTAEAARSAASDVGGWVLAATANLGETAQATAETVRRRVGEASGGARDWATDQSDVLRDTVQTKPFIAIGVSAASAFAAGLVLGVLLARR